MDTRDDAHRANDDPELQNKRKVAGVGSSGTEIQRALGLSSSRNKSSSVDDSTVIPVRFLHDATTLPARFLHDVDHHNRLNTIVSLTSRSRPFASSLPRVPL